jgi:hypothetical protein
VPTLGIHKEFLRDLVKLERPVQQKVVAVLDKFERATHTGIHLEKLDGIIDPRLKSVRVGLDHRGIVLAPENGDHFLLLKVMQHDDAYAWARRRRVSVNSATGEIELRDVAMIEDTASGLADASEDVEPIFANVSDADLVRLGIDEQILNFARLLRSIEPLEALEGYLPQNQYDVLIGLALGYTVDEIWAQVVADTLEPIDPDDIDAAAERMPTKIALVRGPEELMALLEKPFAFWRVYLHPTQRLAAEAPYSGTAQVIGGPGTGKTVVALHRARNLARRGGRVLLTTFTSTLAASLLDNLRLLETDEEVLGRIEVKTVDAVARRILVDAVGRFPVLSADEERELWRSVVRRRKADFSATFLAEEWRQVVLALGITDLDGYLTARRTGRGRRLGPLQRTQVWHAIGEFTRELAERGHRTYETVCAEATELMAATEVKPYDHVIVDEAQDLHPVRWRLLRALVAPGPDDLFIAADTHQRVYDNRVSLKAVGVLVAGRTTRLTVNYRTTAEILVWSHRILSGEEIRDLDDSATSLDGSRSEMHGNVPELVGVTTGRDELAALAAKVRSWLDAGVAPADIGVASRASGLAREAAAALVKAGIPARHLGRDQPKDHDAVQTMTMHRMKGLEFRCVAIIGLSSAQLPAPSSVRPATDDELAHAHDLQRERCLLFVACTRAREALHLSWSGDPSPFLPVGSVGL